MTQEEKAKAYDNAFAKARDNYKTALEYCDGAKIGIECFKNTLALIFPELKESEDERTKGAIIYFISHTPTVPKGTIDKKTMLAWLEKQEHAIACSEEQMKVLNEVLNFAATHENPYWNNYIFETLNNFIRQLKMPCDAYIAGNNDNDKDEEIRKALINVFATHKDYEMFFGVSVEVIRAWLKKQGERESDIRYKYLDELLAADDIYQMSMNEAMTNEAKIKAVSALSKMCISELLGLEKQNEPIEINPSEFDLRLNKLLKQFETLPKEELANSLSFYLNVVQNDGTYKPEKQGENEQILANSENTCKDAWSEEDDYNVQCCIAKAVADMQTGNVGRNNELIEWLKSLKERLSL